MLKKNTLIEKISEDVDGVTVAVSYKGTYTEAPCVWKKLYRTPDGKLFKSKDAAMEHILHNGVSLSRIKKVNVLVVKCG